jgi:bifunctional DNase/RNase
VEIDTRTSDAVALAVRFKCPIYTHEFILKDAGIILDQADDSDTKEEAKTKTPAKKQKKDIASLSLNELNTQLEKALNTEDYEEASKLRDEINRRDGNQN